MKILVKIQTKMFLLGSQLGWMSLGGSSDVLNYIRDPVHKPVLEFSRYLSALRMGPAYEFLVFGRWNKNFFFFLF
jgi:hypothetical protein